MNAEKKTGNEGTQQVLEGATTTRGKIARDEGGAQAQGNLAQALAAEHAGEGYDTEKVFGVARGMKTDATVSEWCDAARDCLLKNVGTVVDSAALVGARRPKNDKGGGKDMGAVYWERVVSTLRAAEDAELVNQGMYVVRTGMEDMGTMVVVPAEGAYGLSLIHI